MKRAITVILLIAIAIMSLGNTGCEAEQTGQQAEATRTTEVGNTLMENQLTPTDIERSLERHNLIKRAYWVNGQRDRARNLPNPIPDMPLGYIILFTNNVKPKSTSSPPHVL